MTPSSETACGAVVVCYYPPAGLAERLLPLLADAAYIVVVDNGPADEHARLAAELSALPRLQLIANGSNLGIATALNQGLRALAYRGIGWGLLLDHDSRPPPEMLGRLIEATRGTAADDVAIFVPTIRYALPEIVCRWPVTQPGDRFFFRRIAFTAMPGPTAVDLAISSGMLINLAKMAEIGWFRDGLFIDLVDTELCLRARQHGYKVVAVPDARLGHALGNVQRDKLFGFVPVYPTHHAPARHGYLARNRVHLWKLYARRFPSWAIYELISGAKLLLKSLLYEPDRWTKLRVTVLGTWTGIRTPPPPLMPPP